MKRILVANRGEIAHNAIRCIREMGMRSVAVYSEVDAGALHTRYADQVQALPGAHPALNYNSPERLLDAAHQTGSDAVYCGYGFLAESPIFARECRQRGVTFIGPSPEVLELCQDKVQLVAKAAALGIPVLKNSGPVSDEEDLAEKAAKIGFPVMLKPVAGTGGRRIAKALRKEDLLELYRSFDREQDMLGIATPFYVEKFARGVTHIEFPVLADLAGNIRHLGDRECVIQRRYQKLIAEAPAERVPQEIKQQMAEAAVTFTRQIGFTGCGAVEFLLDDAGRWYFMEFNPRIPVEYTLTEISFGVELIKEQIRIAAGESLNLPDRYPEPSHHSIECRISAEDPERDFRPSAGVITEYYLPGGYGYSVLSSVQKGQRVEIFYDPMILKINCFAPNRREALAKLAFALDAIRLKGVRTNVPFLRRVIASDEFKTHRLRSDFKIKDFLATRSRDRDRQEVAAIVAALDYEVLGRFRAAPFSRASSGETGLWSTAGKVELLRRRTL